MSDYPIHDRVVAYLEHAVGVYEVPLGSNRGPTQKRNPDAGVDFEQQHDFIPGVGYAWCIAAIQTAWAVAGHPLPYKTAGAYDLWRWAKQVGWARKSSDCVPGDPLIWNIGAGHGSTLTKQLGMNVETIDGNWNNRIQRVVHPRSQCLGGIHVPEAKKQPPAPEPFWVIATSHNGHKQLLFTKFATEKTILKLLPALLAKYGKNGITIKRGGVRK